MNKKKIYDNYMSFIYASPERILGIEKEFMSHYFWNRKYINAFLPDDKKSKILDVACGVGSNLFSFEKFGYKDITGIDISQECVNFCRSRKGQSCKVLKISAEQFLVDKKNKFDVITVYHLVEHIEKDKIISFIKLLKFALRKNGVLIIHMPNGANAISVGHDRYVDMTHETLYTSDSLRELLLVGGFKDEDIIIKEEVGYSSDDRKFLRKIVKTLALPVITFLVDLVWYVFFISQGCGLRKNRPILFSVSINR